MPEILKNNGLVSIIIPCYNGSLLVQETLQSILNQEGVEFEIIFIDDGSKDDSKLKVLSFNDARISYFYQDNAGVSAARNKGLSIAKGDYIVFFDADDKMTPGFLTTRRTFLSNNSSIDFVCGQVQNFTDKMIGAEIFQGACNTKEVLLYPAGITTCPSNYMFKKNFLANNNLTFNNRLASTADRFFLIQCMLSGNSSLNINAGKLLYRISPNSMSNNLTTTLIEDNEKYYKLLLKQHLIPLTIRNESLFIGNMILCKSYWKVRRRFRAGRFALKALWLNPGLFLKNLF
ncbi:MAG: glycosyltransferase family 2 protein [Bacteroidetes bacterium]|nr:glycosyltransferase family 2 protein [Bacteroidota bacterium]